MGKREAKASIALLQKFGARVRELRESSNLSQEGLAEAASLDRTYISGVERGIRNVSLVNINAIACALGVTVSDLTFGINHGNQRAP